MTVDINDKELAIKVFDYFFKKVDVINVKVFDNNREKARLLEFPKGEFCLDVGVYSKYPPFYFIRAIRNGTNQDFMTFYASDPYVDIVSACHFKTLKLANMPNGLKEAVIKSCIDQKTACIIYSKNYYDIITLIPQASSLEELAIKMELET